MSDGRSGEAVSQVQGVLLLVVITIILAVLLFLMLHIPLWQGGSPEEPPEIFAITQLNHYCEKNSARLNYDSRMTIINNGVATYVNDDLRAEIFVNDRFSGALIYSMNAHQFIPTYHIGVERMEGTGSTGYYWYPGSRIFLDLTDGTFRPGDRVRLDIYHKDHDRIISRSERIA